MRLYIPLVYENMSEATASPSHNQSQPFSGKTIGYISMVQGRKIKPAIPTSQGKLNALIAAFTLTGASS